jgi:5'-3' exonuclease
LEADDIAAICVETIKETTNEYDIIIVTNDNDYLQLYEPNKVVIMNLYKKDISSRLPGNKDSQKYLLIKCIMGDKSDFIHSIKKGVGPKTAEMYASNPQAFEAFLVKNPEAQARYDANRTLIDFTRIPSDLKAAAKEQIKLFKDIVQ